MFEFKLNTPVVLLIFKRPEQTAKVFEVVRQVKPPKLLVVADGPRPDKVGEAEKCSAARSIIEKVDWDCQVLTNFSDVNLGCKNRVSSGLNWVFSLVEEAIIIEDDCVPDPSFFHFCEELLERYRDVPQVMSITGENTHGYQASDSSYYFSQYSFYWGWATWKRAWKLFDGSLKLWEGLRETNWLSNLLQNPEATEYWSDIFEQTFNGFNSWGYGWTFTCLVNQGLCAIANNNLISNIGFGEDAAHHTWSVDEIGNLPVQPIQFPLQHPKEIIRDREADLVIDKIRFSGRQKYRIARKLALRYLNTQEYKQSLNWFKQALELRPDLLGLNYGKAVCLARMGQKNEAIDILNHLLKSSLTHPKAKLLLDELAGFTNGEPILNQIVTLEDVVCEPAANLSVASPMPQLPKITPTITVKNASSQTDNITIFAIPKAFKDHINIIQRNAIISWTKLEPRPEIILFGEDEGTAEIATELNLKHIPDVKCNQFGTPLLSDMFERTQQIATFDLVAYVNSDIILLQDFAEGVRKIAKQYDRFMAIGRRWDIDIIAPIDFDNTHWSTELRQLIIETASLHSVHGKDYFVFPRNLFAQIPEFAVGRATWDNWMVHTALERQYAVVDATQGIMAIHQNHDYTHLKGGKLESSRGKEAELNKIAGGYHFSGTIADATEQFVAERVSGTPRVSILIATHNQAKTLGKAIDSVINQSYRDWEIILVDDGSTDNTRQLVEAYSQQVKYIYQQRQGILAAYNRGIQEAKGELVGFLEADSWFLPDKLQHQVACFDARGSVEMVSSGWQIVNTNGAVVEEVQPWSNLPNLDIEELHIWKLWKLWKKFALSAIMFRRRYLNIVGGFNTKLNYIEVAKTDLILKLALKGCLGSWLTQPTCCYIDKAEVKIADPKFFAASFEVVLEDFFQHDELTEWMQVLKPDAKYNSLVFVAWLMHNDSYFELRDHYLKQSQKYNSQITTADWIKSFTRFAREFGYEFDPQSLNNLAIV
jgi:glycosyltransferase involved in cell wall biosynthesis/tetratricopeptide (TPR) repeat protein